MEELVEFIERTPKATMAKHWKDMLHTLPSPLAEIVKPKSWKHIYSMSAINSALSNIQMVGYDQKLVSYSKLHTKNNLMYYFLYEYQLKYQIYQ